MAREDAHASGRIIMAGCKWHLPPVQEPADAAPAFLCPGFSFQGLYEQRRGSPTMGMVETVSDTESKFLSRREITCNFLGLAGKLDKLGAVDAVTSELGLGGKLVIPMNLKNHVGKTMVTGTFYVYDDEALARSHVSSAVFARLDKAKKKIEEAKAAEKPAEEAAEKPAEAAEAKADEGADKPAEAAEAKDEKPAENPAEAKEGS
ncbi:hypothetical protein CENSYa_0426 [Cenarchaeum symbiosum A]|uniref:Uncharacterized protein n=1 Tax=Cenarchaeum symbiosum (strain A) TaxID=414004 RepID=A0RUP4_CENSY|nr:hypothetical protein CENSYa_0426 [Cenarchaeum symbiosum A]